ncbi:putative bifunctional diguanylate cyclase/phosphodiesterase [Pigmentiphaga litoralis]|uniref:putative bifunctional diguanylate cyclase/phosphodiesterase n=1 Tax=Pigmentiphaga litoralis TaxID=516702 RepID=UPI003B42A710
MSIRFKLLVGCLSLTLITLLLGGFMQRSQKEVGAMATQIYDGTFMAVSYLRASQNGLMAIKTAYLQQALGVPGQASASSSPLAAFKPAIDDVLADLEVARDRAMSAEAKDAAGKLRQRVEALAVPSRQSGLSLAELDAIQNGFDTLVEIYAGDGFRYRKNVGRLVDESERQTWIAIGASVLLALAITVLLSRSIIPTLRNAVRIAALIASGKLDNAIDTRSGGEAGQLLSALAAMQSSIAANLERINGLMARQVTAHADELAVQNSRFQAALNNMTQGLCLFDASHRLIVFNRRFAEMFGTPELGRLADEITTDAELMPLLSRSPVIALSHDLSDGRVIAVSRQQIATGGWVATYEDITERRKIEIKLAHMARHDALTGLPNRVLFREHMEQTLRQQPRDTGLAVLSLDLDGFKNVNDSLGHPMGDALLQAVAERLRGCTRETDLVARLGGDEFAIIQKDVPQLADTRALANRIVEALNAPFEIDSQLIQIGASVGIATLKDVLPAQGPLAADLFLKSADLALYRAKSEGRGTYRFFEAEMDALHEARRSLEVALRVALERQEFELFYQPLVNTAQQEISGFEALLRWNHPQRGVVSPMDFIPVAEELGLIKHIGRWVLHEACREAAGWPENVNIAVNLSSIQFRNHDLVGDVASALALSGLAPNRLELEITESLLLQDNAAVLATLHQLRKLGVSISMDDFGTGYSSLSYLQKFPFDKIKIDQSFIQRLSEQDSVSIVRAVISLGRSLGMSILAEGVETAEQLKVLQAEGCWDIQGYLVSPPKPALDTIGLIDRYCVGVSA